ncbi:hypothetical protein EVAR_31291_1 [Eumeta japonica]|uniref:Uncharacterized protein n=1 Tax=Eumeta variegata TaxID=151549 RepID=A0A4C1VPV5_EUMVA|nr:hypothetical protein EVAR_31291_1 [Eumeta japonica]
MEIGLMEESDVIEGGVGHRNSHSPDKKNLLLHVCILRNCGILPVEQVLWLEELKNRDLLMMIKFMIKRYFVVERKRAKRIHLHFTKPHNTVTLRDDTALSPARTRPARDAHSVSSVQIKTSLTLGFVSSKARFWT